MKNTTMEKPLEKEFRWYLSHQEELVQKYDGKFIVIKGEEVFGAYDNLGDAVDETEKTLVLGTFLVQKCTSGDEDTKAIFRSRVVLH
jgi:hypothetical protein